MMSDSFLYSGDDAAMMSELQSCHVAVTEYSGISSESEAGLSGYHWHLLLNGV